LIDGRARIRTYVIAAEPLAHADALAECEGEIQRRVIQMLPWYLREISDERNVSTFVYSGPEAHGWPDSFATILRTQD
jgi:hypothetical protein